MKHFSSQENYLETILILSQNQDTVRSIDVAHALSFSKPSVSRAMGILKKEGFIQMADNGHIHLTDKGLKKASALYDRHKTLTAFLVGLGVDPKTAEEDACQIEHVISQSSFAKIKALTQQKK